MKKFVLNIILLLFIISPIKIIAADQKSLEEKKDVRTQAIVTLSQSIGYHLPKAQLVAAGKIDLHHKDSAGNSLLHLACSKCPGNNLYAKENGDAVDLLIKAKINVNILNTQKDTPLELYCQRHPIGCCQPILYALLEAKADVTQKAINYIKFALDSGDGGGQMSPINLIHNHLQIIKEIEEAEKSF